MDHQVSPGGLLIPLTTASRATLPVGGVAGGALGTALGLRTTLWLAAAGLLLSWLWLVLTPACRARDLPTTRTAD